MRKEIRVTIPEPCHEDWNQMTPKDQGRHCKVCEKTVIDFTNKTDEYIVKTYEKEAKLCGRFKQQQLGRPLAYSRKESTNYLAVASTALLAYLSFGSNNAYAQGKPKADTTSVATTNHIKGKIAQSVLKTKVVSGTVFGDNNYRIPGVRISIKGNKTQAKSDMGGDFTIKTKVNDTLLLEISGYKTNEVIIDEKRNYKIILTKKPKEQITTTHYHINESLENAMPICGLQEQQTQRIIIGGALTKQAIRKASRKSNRFIIRQGFKKRTFIGRILFTISSPFRKN